MRCSQRIWIRLGSVMILKKLEGFFIKELRGNKLPSLPFAKKKNLLRPSGLPEQTSLILTIRWMILRRQNGWLMW